MKQKIINFHLLSSDKNTGYGNASINMIDALTATGAKVNPIFPGRIGPSADIDFFLRPPPWNMGRARRKIGYFYWEATPLPNAWANSLNHVNEIWSPCKLVEDCCRLAKFAGKIYRVPTPAKPINVSNIPIAEFEGIDKSAFIFYSIFQWHNRKGWNELINAYFDEFSSGENVALIIKTNAINSAFQPQIQENIIDLKLKYKNKKTSPLILISGIIPEQDILSIHRAGHCYVSPHHGEGWGMPIHDAIMLNKQIIATKFGGVTEYLDDNSFYPIPFKMGPVTGMEWNSAYNSSQRWAIPDVDELKKIMRNVFENYNKYAYKNMLINKTSNELSFDSIVNLIKKLL